MKNMNVVDFFATNAFVGGMNRLENAFGRAISEMGKAKSVANADSAEACASEILDEQAKMNILMEEVQLGLEGEALCEAFIMAAFHFWEKTARNLDPAVRFNGAYGEMVNSMERRYAVHARLLVVNLMVNAIKHHNSKKARKLYEIWPDAFKEEPRHIRYDHWHWELKMDQQLVKEVFNIVRASGPTMNRYADIEPV
ncbi:hypothetical protein MOK15_18905 [Sphingobium sp. BYY-5]|uniref:hypothetical protein n=1 Tax=Sphingobium sp. BYY-5 TaxID=2926400 RepID=UPI001FA6C257|nr:hypothetical protein [Sphingobium sp. BYY-5]MCI4592157.1 hypothetical protein [Sphingobium sp. BYY-5]